ncbi:hypothetical protein O181_124290 [Austropuccinia psidii MF-1]|uniref:CCHC-type domain-containing protein n=1 Tax=Austropuccinia psidii MF-1 TaxID=1389203 RepID=A0A9Q3KSX2_9BASI|nr:hypothetical protein [Austropuccinia psidii MF-1]
MAPRPPLKCAYCKEEGHSATRCTHLAEDLDKRIVRTQGASYLFPNYQRVPIEGNESVKDIVRAFAKEQEELNKKFMEKQVETKLEIDKIIGKIMQQKINLTIDKILRMSPNFVHKLQELSEKDKEKIESLHSMDIQERLLSFGFKEIPKPNIHYACPLGFCQPVTQNQSTSMTAKIP